MKLKEGKCREPTRRSRVAFRQGITLRRSGCRKPWTQRRRPSGAFGRNITPKRSVSAPEYQNCKKSTNLRKVKWNKSTNSRKIECKKSTNPRKIECDKSTNPR
jgi:hypothetical protein